MSQREREREKKRKRVKETRLTPKEQEEVNPSVLSDMGVQGAGTIRGQFDGPGGAVVR